MPRDLPDFSVRKRRMETPREQDILDDTFREFAQQQTWRATFATHWEEISELIDPPSKNTFMYGNFNWPGQKKSERQVDATGMMALSRFAAICDSLLTPRNMFWHGLAADNDYVNKQRNVRLYFEQTAKILFKHRYRPHANFSAQNQSIYKNLGAYGTAALFADEFDTTLGGTPGIRYKQIPLGELFMRENHQGMPDGFTRWFRMTAQQAWEKPGWKERFPELLETPLKANSPMPFNFLHRVVPRTDWDPDMLDERGMKWASYYVFIEGRCLLSEGGYHKLPAAITRYEQTPGEMYGRSPAMFVLPALKTLNAEKTTFLKQGHRAADPVLFTSDDGVVDASMRPGALNKGGVSADGKLLVHALPSGDIQINKEMMDEEKSLINDAFLVTLFQILTETPTMTATEVIERTNEKGILLAPTVGRQQSEYLGPLIERELDILSRQGLLPPMPPVLREAQGEYTVVYTSPLSRAMRAQEAAGFFRTLEGVKELVAITQDHSLLDGFNFDVAVPAIADIQAVPESWMASPEQVIGKRKMRAAQQEQAAKIQAMPAQAAMMKAQAVAAKAGAAPPGQLPAEGGGPLAEQMGG